MKDMLRKIPKVDNILRNERWSELRQYPEDLAKTHLREVLEEVRDAIKAGRTDALSGADAIIDETARRTARTLSPALRRVINGTGVVIHTNLGRAPLALSAIDRLLAVASGYSNLEYNLEKGERGDRHTHSVSLLARLTGAESAVVVNNNAAAVLLVLNTLAEGKEVVIGRGELVEIGGSFRIPEVMKKSGAVLREVGTTNRTFAEDYEQAINENTGLIMKVHTSNYRIKGFVHEATSDELSALAKRYKIPFYFDAGSGLFFAVGSGLDDASEPVLVEEAGKGIEVISFSGDKLLGGPQAGIILGKKEIIGPIKKNPLTRALRPDKFTLAALEATLRLYLDPRAASQEIPALRMLSLDEETLRKRARRVARALRRESADAEIQVIALYSEVGGGSFPDVYIPSYGLALRPSRISVDALDRNLRSLDVPVIGRIEKERFLIDMRTIQGGDERDLTSGLSAALRNGR
jgi:L-seryl-tRNA(Ser) seleniumtransferase